MSALPKIAEFSGQSIFVDRTDRGRLWLTGPDRAKFLNNVCTQDVLSMSLGKGKEAFITSLQGKTLAYVLLHALPDARVVRTDADVLPVIMPHLQKYGIFDEVVLEDRSASSREWHLAGSQAVEILNSIGIHPVADMESVRVPVASGEQVLLIPEAPFGIPGWTVIGTPGTGESWAQQLDQACQTASTPVVTLEVLEGFRILTGIPRNGQDVTPANLPQELDRNDQSISFKKGCYLGQETVARLDALGHVNKILRILTVDGSDLPTLGVTVRAGEKEAGTVSSVGQLPGGRVVALAMLKVNLAPVGAEVEILGGDRSYHAQVHPITGG